MDGEDIRKIVFPQKETSEEAEEIIIAPDDSSSEGDAPIKDNPSPKDKDKEKETKLAIPPIGLKGQEEGG